ncbi:MAG: nickel-dependent lactate racemase [Thermodesulfobacteriota bacterium]|nr:nickel-dependent lactate racemase [Thermodesulfobacteriota bacterium]
MMLPDLKKAIKKIDVKDWKKVSLEFGRNILEISVPPGCVELGMKDVPVLPNPEAAIEKAFSNPIGSPPLEEVIKKKEKLPNQIKVAIAVSDITRPVPYKGEKGILLPILKRLESSGIRKQNIKIIIATGMHRPSTDEEKADMFGKEVVDQYSLLDHDCENDGLLESIGTTQRGTNVYVNRDFFSSDLKIATGLVESHFMTGVSGGRKSICPGLVDVKTIQRFHGVNYLENPNADNLILEGNPCHEEAIEVARTVGVDLIANVTLNKDMEITGVFVGHLEEAHMAAYRHMKGYTVVPVDQEYDIVLTHGGYVGRNHYQTAKAACGAVPVVKKGGVLIVAADNRDQEPIGTPEYRSLIHLLKLQGIESYLKIISHPDWRFTKDQWEPEVWGRVLKKIGEEGLIYCTLEISEEDYCLLPGLCGLDFLKRKKRKPSLEQTQEMVQNAVRFAVNRYREKGIEPTMAFIREGPYAVPILRG